MLTINIILSISGQFSFVDYYCFEVICKCIKIYSNIMSKMSDKSMISFKLQEYI